MSKNLSLQSDKYDVAETAIAFLIEGLRTQSLKRGLIMGAADILANLVPKYGYTNSYNRNWLMEPVLGGIFYAIGAYFVDGKTAKSFVKNFLIGLVVIEAASGFASAYYGPAAAVVKTEYQSVPVPLLPPRGQKVIVTDSETIPVPRGATAAIITNDMSYPV